MGYKVELDHASCTIEPMMDSGLSNQAVSRIRNLTHLYVNPEYRNQGQASALLAKVNKEADEAGVALLVSPEPYGDYDLDQSELETFYAKHGYVRLQDEPLLMVRYVNAWNGEHITEPPKRKASILDCHGNTLN
jgi:GNAT superfamily N-acetyltransferase